MTRILSGTAAVVGGGRTVTFTGVPLSDANCPADATVVLGGATYYVDHRTDTSHFVLTRDYEGANGTVSCEIDPLNANAISLVKIARSITDYNARLALLNADGQGLFYTSLGVTGANDPGPGKIARNNVDWALSTAIYLDVLDAGSKLAAPLIDLWASASILVIRSLTTRAYVAFQMTGSATDMGPGQWRQISGLSYVGSDGLIGDGEDVAVEWRVPGADKDVDAQVNTLALRAAFDGQAAGFRVMVANVGDGRAARYSKLTATIGDWSAPAYFTGPQGAASTVPGIVWRGAYSAATAYNANDGVLDSGSSWRAKTATTGNAPPALPTTGNTQWELLAAKGADGLGTGDFVGPSSAVDGNVVVFDGTTGKRGKDSGSKLPVAVTRAVAIAGADNAGFVSPLRLRDALDNSPLNGFRDKIINGRFPLWQRGFSQTASGYASDDRWVNASLGNTKVHSRQAFPLGQTDVPGNPKYFSRTVVTSVAGAGNLVQKVQRIEGVDTFAGEKATLTFYAKSDAPRNISVDFLQAFGTGGSPSPDVVGITPTVFALTTAWKRFDLVADIPSIAGKTLGTSGTDQLAVEFWYDAGANFAVRSAGLGQQSGTFDLANVSFVKGDARGEANPADARNIQQEIALAQRFYCKSFPVDFPPANGAAANSFSAISYENNPVVLWANIAGGGCTIYLPTMMRAVPTVTNYGNNAGLWCYDSLGSTLPTAAAGPIFAANLGAYALSQRTLDVRNNVSSNAVFGARGHWAADAEL